MRSHDGRDPEEVLRARAARAGHLRAEQGLLRELLATQIDLTTLGTGYVRDAHERFQRMQEDIQGGEKAPRERIIEENRDKSGEEYRLETEGRTRCQPARPPLAENPRGAGSSEGTGVRGGATSPLNTCHGPCRRARGPRRPVGRGP